MVRQSDPEGVVCRHLMEVGAIGESEPPRPVWVTAVRCREVARRTAAVAGAGQHGDTAPTHSAGRGQELQRVCAADERHQAVTAPPARAEAAASVDELDVCGLVHHAEVAGLH